MFRHLTNQARKLLHEEGRLRDGGDDAAHRMRVAARRIRSTLRTCAPLLQPDPAREFSVRLKWLADALAGERDNEVILARLLDGLDALPERNPGTGRARAAVARRLRAGLHEGHSGALAALDSPEFGALAAQLREPGFGLLLTAKAAAPASRAVPKLVGRTVRRFDKAVHKLPPDDDGYAGSGDPDWHRVRIRAKRARYAAELYKPHDKGAGRLAKRMKGATEVLGLHQDAAMAAQVAGEVGGGARVGGPAAFVLGELHSRQRYEALARRRDFVRLLPGLHRNKARKWISA